MRMHSFKASTRFSWRAADLQAGQMLVGGGEQPESVTSYGGPERPAGCAQHRAGTYGPGQQSLIW